MWIRLGTRHALAGAALALAMLLAACALALGNLPAFRDPELLGSFAQAVVPTLAISLIGGLIAFRLPRKRIGWILLSAAIINGATALLSQYLVHTLLVAKGSLPGVQWAAWLNSVLGGFIYPGMVVLIMLFLPDGHLPSRRWVWLIWADLGFTLLNTFLGIADPTPIRAPGIPPVNNPTGISLFGGLQTGPLGYATFYLMMLLVLAGVASLALRLRRAKGEERQQVRWIVYALSLAVSLDVLLSLSLFVVPPSPEGRVIENLIANALVVLGFGVAFPAAIGVAILKYRLYDIDVVINRTVVFGALAAFITAVYVSVAVGLGSLIGAAGQPNLALSVLATAVVAVAFQPVRERVQRLANRLVYGKRATPYEVMADFSERLSETLAPEEVLPRMAEAAARGVAAEAARVTVTFPDGREREVWWPRQASVVAFAHRFPVNYKDVRVGEIAVAKVPGAPVTASEARLLEVLAAQAGLVLHNIRLATDLQSRLDQLTAQAASISASRQRLFKAAAIERQRLQRTIRDGAEHDLALVASKLAAVDSLLDSHSQGASAAFEKLTEDVQSILDSLRKLAHGIYPPLLRDQGLGPALRSQVTRDSKVTRLEIEGLHRYAPQVEAAVYFCCQEALRELDSCPEVRVVENDGHLEFRIAGLDAARGRFQDIEDRIEAVGGRVLIAGSTISGRIPLDAAKAAGAAL